MTALLAGIWPYLAAAGGAVLALVVAWSKGKRDAEARAALDRAESWQQAKERADGAAGQYRDGGGAADRLRDGSF